MDSESHSRQGPSSLFTKLPTLEDPVMLLAHLNQLLNQLSMIVHKTLRVVHMWNTP